MATIKLRLEVLESAHKVQNNNCNLEIIVMNQDETEQEAIVRQGYEPLSDLSKFMFIELVEMPPDIT